MNRVFPPRQCELSMKASRMKVPGASSRQPKRSPGRFPQMSPLRPKGNDMRRFARLYRELDETTKTSRKIAALRAYFATVDPADGAWALFFLCGRRLKRLVLSRNLQQW